MHATWDARTRINTCTTPAATITTTTTTRTCIRVFTRSVGLQMPAASAPLSMPAATFRSSADSWPSAPSSRFSGV